MTTESGFIERLFRVHEGQLQTYLTQMVGCPDIARDLAQESLERVRRSYRPGQVVFPRAMLFRVATNFALMHLRHRRAERMGMAEAPQVEEAQEVPGHRMGLDQQVSADQICDYLASAIKALRPTLRRVFVMAHVQGMPRQEIAAALGLSEKRVDKRMTAALKECRDRLAARGIDLAQLG